MAAQALETGLKFWSGAEWWLRLDEGRGGSLLPKSGPDREWLALQHATIADLACYPYVARAAEGGVDTSSFNHVCRWVESVEAIPGFWPMPLIPNLPTVPLVPVPVT